MRLRNLAWVAGVLASASMASGAAISLSSNYSQNFDSLANSGTSNAWTNDSTISGWYTSRTTYRASAGGDNAGSLYSFGAASSNERALGSIASGATGLTTIFAGARFVNDTANATVSLTIAFTGEQWRMGGAGSPATSSLAQTLDFQYQVGATSLTTGTWTDFNALDFTTPVFGPTTAVALDGNLAANKLSLSQNLTVSVAAGQEVWLRWVDINDANNDHALAIDDFSIRATFEQPGVVIPTPAAAGAGLVLMGLLAARRQRG